MEDKLRILKMLEDGLIKASEAAELLEALKDENSNSEVTKVVASDDDFFKVPKGIGEERMLCIRVLSSDGDKVKVNLPLSIVKIFMSSGKKLPGVSNNVDVDMDSIIAAIDSGYEGRIVDIDSGDGDIVVIEIA